VSQIDVSDGDLIVFIGGIIVGISLGLLTNVSVTSKGKSRRSSVALYCKL